MASYCKTIMLGNVTRDVEVKFTQRGTAIANVSLALNRKWKTESGEQKESVSFIDCTAMGKRAEILGQYVKKGNPLLVSGYLEQQTWDDKQTGQKRSKVVVMIEDFQMLGGKSDGPRAERPTAAQATSAPASDASASAPSSPNEPPMPEDDVPF